MNKKGLIVAAALLCGSGLTTALPGVSLQTARAEDLNEMFRVDFGTRAGRNGQTRITATSITTLGTRRTTCGSSSVDSTRRAT